MNRESAVYPIGLVEKITGLSGRKIRYYERCGLLNPERTEGKHRLYTKVEVDRLNEIKALREQGMNLTGIKASLGGSGGGGVFPGGSQPENVGGRKGSPFREKVGSGSGFDVPLSCVRPSRTGTDD